jgi:hypothetical protein
VSCSLHDVVRLEGLGVPTAAVGTDPFRDEALEMAEVLGMPDYRMVEVPHPIEPIPLERVVGYADDVVEEVVKHLTA